MPVELTVAKAQDGSLKPVSAADAEILSRWRVGQGLTMKATQQHPRSLSHHRKYWGGLIELAFEYWEPEGGLVSAAERKTLERFAAWLDKKSSRSGAVSRAAEAFMAELAQHRAGKIDAPEKSKQALHDWIKEQAGWFSWVQTPSGLKRQLWSINFNALDQPTFERYYKDAFGVCWRFILSRTFETENQAQHAVNQLLMLE